MKNLVLVMLALVGFSLSVNAQEQKKNKNAKHDIEVRGNCEMCKKRIEKAAFGVKGVKSAEWHSDDQTLHVLMDENKTSTLVISQAIAKAGHDTKEVKAPKDNYESLHGCCQYDRES